MKRQLRRAGDLLEELADAVPQAVEAAAEEERLAAASARIDLPLCCAPNAQKNTAPGASRHFTSKAP